MSKTESQIAMSNYAALYVPLDASRNEIRLVRVKPHEYAAAKLSVQPGDATPIYCELVKCSAEENPEYTAVSYVWGNASDTLAIIANEQEVQD
jgi:hypothetical protein